MLTGVQHRMMFYRGRDHVVPGAGDSENREVIRFRSATCKDNLRWTAAHQLCHRRTCCLDGSPRLLPMVMNGRGIPKMLAEVRPHGLKNLRKHRGSRAVVEVNAPHGTWTSGSILPVSMAGRGLDHLAGEDA